MVLNVYRIDKANVGDLHCSPVRYFSQLQSVATQCILEEISCVPQMLILGGGGLLYFSNRMRALCELPAVTVVWGVGANCHGVEHVSHPRFLEDCRLVGVRDYGFRYRWVPCVSCLSAVFEDLPVPSHDVVAFEHAGVPLRLPLPTLRNNCTDLQQVATFLASGDTVVTNSYHGAYWATLLGRRVVVIPFSSKFYGFKHAPVISSLAKFQFCTFGN
jgi:hypothetical protein